MISVIIPTHNSEKYIIDCLNSVFTSTYTNYEVIIVDDGSTDNTINYIKSIRNHDIKIYYCNNNGPGFARNVGIKHSKGNYIYFIDSDDTINPNTFELLLREIKGNDIVIGNYKIIYDDGTIENFITPLDSDFNSFFESVTIWNRLYLKSFIVGNNVKFDNIYQGEDRLFLAKLYLLNPRFKVISESIYNWIRHDTAVDATLTHLPTKDRFYSQVNCMKSFLKLLINEVSPEEKELLLNHLRYSCVYLMEIYKKVNDDTCNLDLLLEFADLLEFDKNKELYSEIFNKKWSDKDV